MANIHIGKGDIIWSYIGSFFKVAANIILLPVVLKLLTDDELGIWYVFGSVSQIVVLLDFGFAATVARNIAYAWCGVDSLKKDTIAEIQENQETNFEYFKLVLQTCKVIYTVIAGIALLFLLTAGLSYINSLDPSSIVAWIIYSLGVALNMRYCYYTSFLLGVGAVAENNKAAIITKLVQIVVAIILLYAGYGVLGVSIAYLLSGIALRLSSKLYFDNYEKIKVHLSEIKTKTSWAEVKNTFKIIWHNASKDGLVTLANYLNTQANTLICSSVLGLATTGSYGLSVQLSAIAASIAGIPFSSTLPKLQEKAVKRDNQGGQKLFSGTMILFMVSFIIITGFVILLLPVIKWLKPTLTIDVWLLLAVFFLALINQVYHYCASLISTFNTLPYTKAFIISSVVAVLLSYLLTKYTGIGIWGLVLAPLIVAFSYNVWKWPLYVLNLYDVSLSTFIKSGFSFSKTVLSEVVTKLKLKKIEQE